MPDVVVIKEVEQDAIPVVLPGLGWCFLQRGQSQPVCYLQPSTLPASSLRSSCPGACCSLEELQVGWTGRLGHAQCCPHCLPRTGILQAGDP